MKIKGSKIVTGLYVYDDKREFTTDDFVISDGVIYVCTRDVVGEDPKLSDAYSVYLGDKTVDPSDYQKFLENHSPDDEDYLKEYKEFLENQEGINKYLSVRALQGVMSEYLMGPTGKGIIGDYVYYDSGNYQVSLPVEFSKDCTYENIISEIMFHPEINHAHFRVSRLLPEITGYVGSVSVSEFSGEDEKSVILRQYTYLQEGTDYKIRLQELIDPIDGVIWYRSGALRDDKAAGNWRCSVVSQRVLKQKIENLIGVYNSRLKVIKSIEDHLKSNFRYRKMVIQGERPTTLSPGEVSEITLTISEEVGEGLVRNYETTINLNDRLEGGEMPSYLIGERYIIEFSVDGMLELKPLNKTSEIQAWFSGAYYREYYG